MSKKKNKSSGNFMKWLHAEGVKNVARLLGTESPTVKAWLYKGCCPRSDTMVKLVELGKGAFTLEDIVKECATSKVTNTLKA